MTIDTRVRRPDAPDHWMRIKPLPGTVEIRHGDLILARSGHAVRVMENGRDLYDPVIYVPQADVSDSLAVVPGKSTHCPLKGDCSYLALAGQVLGWTYDRPTPFAPMLKDHVAFYADRVAITEKGPAAP